MSALKSFLRLDPRAAALVAAALAGPAAVALADRPATDASLPPAAGLVRIDVEANRLAEVAAALHKGALDCLREQGRMLDRVSGGRSGSPLDPVEARSRENQEDTRLRPETALARDWLSRGRLSAEQRGTLAHHLAFRDACLDWTARSVSTLTGNLGLAEPGRAASALALARQAAARDAEMVDAILQGGAPDDPDVVERMATYAGP